MSWFGRSRSSPAQGPRDESLTALTQDQAVRFTAAAQRAFADAGLETVPRGRGSLQAGDDFVLNLHNIAHAAAGVPERQWPRMLAEHARTILAAHRSAGPTSLETLDGTLCLRLFDRTELPGEPWGRAVAGRLFAVAAVDHPTHVQSLPAAADVERLGGWPVVEHVGLANLRRFEADDVGSLEHDVHVSVGGFFNASRLLVLDTVLASDFRVERPSHGVLVAVPNRHVLAVHVVADATCLDAVRTLVALAQQESDAPGGLSDEVYFWRDGRTEQVTRRDGDRTTVVATGMLGAAMTELGLLSDR